MDSNPHPLPRLIQRQRLPHASRHHASIARTRARAGRGWSGRGLTTLRSAYPLAEDAHRRRRMFDGAYFVVLRCRQPIDGIPRVPNLGKSRLRTSMCPRRPCRDRPAALWAPHRPLSDCGYGAVSASASVPVRGVVRPSVLACASLETAQRRLGCVTHRRSCATRRLATLGAISSSSG